MSRDQNENSFQHNLDGSAKVLIALVICIPLLWIWHGVTNLGLLPMAFIQHSSHNSFSQHFLIAVLIGVAGFSLYFLPAIVAKAGGRRNVMAIAALNFFLGWTVVGWVAALVWALTRPAPQQVIFVQSAPRNEEGP